MPENVCAEFQAVVLSLQAVCARLPGIGKATGETTPCRVKRMTMIFALVASVLLLASCADPQPPAGSSAELCSIMEANREIALLPLHPDFYEIVAGLLRPSFDPEAARRVAKLFRANLPSRCIGFALPSGPAQNQRQ